MSYTVPTCEPDDIVAADSLQWDKTLADFPASEGWELTYQLRCEGGAGATGDLDIGFDATLGPVSVDGDVFQVRVAAATTADLIAGPYRLTARVSGTDSDGNAVTKSWLVKRVICHADPATDVGAKSFSRTMRDTLRTALQTAAADGAYVTVQANGRSVTYARAEAKAELAHYEYLVAVEENATGEISHAAEFVRG